MTGSSAEVQSKISPLRIAICPPEFQPFQQAMNSEPAEATYIIQAYIAEFLKARGHDLTFVAPHGLNGVIFAREIDEPAPAPRGWTATRLFDLASKMAWQTQKSLGVPYLNVFSNLRRYDACLQCFPGREVVYERSSLYKKGVAMACRRLKIPYVLYFEADDILEHDYMGTPITGLLRWRARKIAKYNLDAANCVICVSEPSKRHLINAWGVPAEKIAVFSNAADIHLFRPDPGARAEVRTSLGIGSNPMIIFVGYFYKWHDIETLLDAFALLARSNSEARLVLVGDGAQHKAAIQRSVDLGLDNAVRFIGRVPHSEVPRLMAAADIGVVPYPHLEDELWLSPLKLYEYMSCGTAVVASASGQLVEAINDGRNGALVPPGDVSALAMVLRKLIKNPDLRSRMGEQARKDVMEKHSWEGYISQLEKLLATVVSNQSLSQI